MKKNTFRFINNNWVITLTATLIGVFAALYLNEIVASKKVYKQKTIATDNIFKEIDKNRQSLEKNIQKLEVMAGTLHFMNKHQNDEGELIASIDEMNDFKNKYPGVLKLKDSTRLDNRIYKYKGEGNIDFNISYINLTTVALNTLKISGLISFYEFDCLMNLERLEKFTNETLYKEKEIIEKIYNSGFNSESEEIFSQLDILIKYEKTLIEFYSSSKESLKECG